MWLLPKSFHPRHQPWSCRQSYRFELGTVLTYPAAMGMVEGGVVGILANNAFALPPSLLAVIMAAPSFANLTSFFWARLARGRRKVAFINLLQIAVLLCIAAVALLPTNPHGGVLLTLLMVLVRCLAAGIVTVRSSLWRHNYPRAVRATVTGRLTFLQSLIMAVVPMATYWVMDHNPQGFRVIYPLTSLIAIYGVMAFSHIRMRREKELLRYEKLPRATPRPHGGAAPIYEYHPEASDASFWSVLRHDHFYRHYMVAQMLGGGANMMGEAVVILLVTHLTMKLGNRYLMGIVLTTGLPMLLAIITMPFWARFLDRVHIVHFRAKQSWLWVADQCMNFTAALVGLSLGYPMTGLGLLFFARTLQGIVRGGGMLAWNLGHNDFASRKLVAVYMGIHVTLTGVRGAIFPFVGIWLYTGWNGTEMFGWTVPAFAGIGAWVFLVTAGMTLWGNISYNRLDKQITAQKKAVR